MAARGTPEVAVVSGNVVQKDGAISGKGVRLYGDDGNLYYYYFHLDAYAGPPRHVQQGRGGRLCRQHRGCQRRPGPHALRDPLRGRRGGEPVSLRRRSLLTEANVPEDGDGFPDAE
jgi:hypothetical protein